MRRILNQIIPFIFLGIALVALSFSLMILFYLFLFGAVVGVVLFAINWIREKFFPPKNIDANKKSGRVIDSDDWKKL